MSIPAWAGETATPAFILTTDPVYPRVGGGNHPGRPERQPAAGLSPRGRGKLVISNPPFCGERSIPAWAGETDALSFLSSALKVYPRVGGGNEKEAPDGFCWEGLSPRGRGKPLPQLPKSARHRSIPAWAGKRHVVYPSDYYPRSIPAWAGETDALSFLSSALKVYPRVGGGNEKEAPDGFCWEGLSPRGRGKPLPQLPKSARHRSIPAWAGETPRSLPI